MQDQDNSITEAFKLDRGAHVMVPAIIVDWLRDAAYAEIGAVAEALITAAIANDRELRPRWFRTAADTLKQIFALLDAIGWAKSVPPIPVRLDVRADYCWALIQALLGATEFADDGAETPCCDVEETWQDLMLAQDLSSQRVGALWDFIANARAAIDEWTVEQGDGEGLVLDRAA
jgi:hypothetical protein